MIGRRGFLRTVAGALIGAAIPLELPVPRPIVRFAEWKVSSLVLVSEELLEGSFVDFERLITSELAAALAADVDRMFMGVS